MSQVQVSEKKESKDFSESHVHEEERGNLKGDYGNVAILLFLYLLQGESYILENLSNSLNDSNKLEISSINFNQAFLSAFRVPSQFSFKIVECRIRSRPSSLSLSTRSHCEFMCHSE